MVFIHKPNFDVLLDNWKLYSLPLLNLYLLRLKHRCILLFTKILRFAVMFEIYLFCPPTIGVEIKKNRLNLEIIQCCKRNLFAMFNYLFLNKIQQRK